jgi:hypothetical protein
MGDERIHFEQYLHLPALTHNSAIVAWGGFYFEVEVDDDRGSVGGAARALLCGTA